MQLQNFECQIAKAQIGRFLAGDGLSDETVQQLEAHIAKCPDCKQNLAERKVVLQAVLSSGDQSDAAPQPIKAKFDLADFVKSKIQAKQAVHAAVRAPTAKPTNLSKPAIYSVALGVVLIGMSYASKNVGSIFGPTAATSSTLTPANTKSTTAAITPAPKPVAPPTNTPKPTPQTVASPTVKPSQTALKPIPLSPSTTKISTPPQTTNAPTSKPTAHRTKTAATKARPHSQRHKAPRHSNTNNIRVYAPGNQP